MKFFLIGCIILLGCAPLMSRELNEKQFYAKPDTTAPQIFILGEDEALEAYLERKYPEGIIDAFEGDAQMAFSKWAIMLQTMEAYAKKQDFNIKGIKAFATIYWDKNGEIDHFAYSLKAHSAYIESKELDTFFLSFMKYYTLPIKAKTGFQHTFTLALPYPSIIRRPAPVIVEN